ncbi:MAG: glycosyltransferase family 39 protein [Planctomycetota bacterium]
MTPTLRPTTASAIRAGLFSPTGLLFAVCAASAICFVLQAGFAPLRGSEGRYAEVARTLAESNDPARWLAPQWRGQVHLTKPPLAYWPQAVAIRVLGPTEFAVRLPSALASIALVIMTSAWAGMALAGPRIRRRRARCAAAAAACLLATPLLQAVGRLGITDAPFAACWTAVLLAGHAAARATNPRTRRRAAMAMWACVALATLIKGHAGLLPPAIVIGWLAWARDRTALKRLRIAVGLPLSLAPVLLWAAAVASFEPGAWDVWTGQTLGRLTDNADHAQPWWFFFPIAMAGLFPATALIQVAFRTGRRQARLEGFLQNDVRATVQGLCAWAIVLPFLVFSLQSGKLMSYLLPIAPPAAILAAVWVERWLDFAPSIDRRFAPSPTACLMIGAIVAVATLVLGARFYFGQWPDTATALAAAIPAALAIVAVGLHLSAERAPNPTTRRRWALASALGTVALLGPAFAAVETHIYRSPAPALAEHAKQTLGMERPQVGLVGFDVPGLGFYTGATAGRVDPRFPREQWQAMRKDNLVLYAEPSAWQDFNQQPFNLLHRRYQPLGQYKPQPTGDTAYDLYRPRPRSLQPDRQGELDLPVPR